MADGSYERVPPETLCGCYECQQTFPFKSVAEFWDEGDTPVCPFCGRDAVVVSTADLAVTPARLAAMRKTYT